MPISPELAATPPWGDPDHRKRRETNRIGKIHRPTTEYAQEGAERRSWWRRWFGFVQYDELFVEQERRG